MTSQRRQVGLLEGAMILFRKDLAIEARTREIVTTAGFFALLVAVLASVSFYAGATSSLKVAPGALWIALAFSSILALSRTWQREREESAMTGLLVSGVPRASIFLGKALGVFTFLLAIEVALVPLIALLFHIDLLVVAPGLVPLLLFGTLGIASMGTLFGVMTVRTNARDLVLASVLFPLLAPSLVTGVVATRELFAGATIRELTDYYLILAVFATIGLAGGLGLFDALVEG